MAVGGSAPARLARARGGKGHGRSLPPAPSTQLDPQRSCPAPRSLAAPSRPREQRGRGPPACLCILAFIPLSTLPLPGSYQSFRSIMLQMCGACACVVCGACVRVHARVQETGIDQKKKKTLVLGLPITMWSRFRIW